MKLSQQKLLHYMQEKPKRDFFTDKIIEIVEPKNAEGFVIVGQLLKCIKTTRYSVGSGKIEVITNDKIKRTGY